MMTEERMKFDKEKQVLESELLRRRKEEIGKVKNDFETQLSALKMQIQKSDDLRAKEVGIKVYIKYYIKFILGCFELINASYQ